MKIKGWKIEGAATKKDPDRRQLLVKASLADVRSLVRQLGKICSRPKKVQDDPDFNYSLFLHQATDEILTGIETEMNSIAGPPAAPSQEAPPAGPAPAEPAPGGTSPPAPAPAEAAPAPAEPAPDVSESSKKSQGGGVHLDFTPGPAGPGASGGPAPAGPAPAEPAPAVASAAQPPAPSRQAPAAAPQDAKPMEAQPLLGSVQPCEPRFTFESCVVGVHNRFAHAAATSVVSSPGNLYNPLFISGPAGSGKSHMLHSIAAQFQIESKGVPVWLTTGSRLSQAAALAVHLDRLGELVDYARQAQALIIDDFHLAAVSEQNQPAIAQVVKTFIDSGKQVVLASIYAQKLLGALENSFQIRISSGHSVELKLPSESKRKEIVQGEVEKLGLQGGETQVSAMTERVAADFPQMDAVLKRARVYADLMGSSGQPVDLGTATAALFPPDAGASEASAAELGAALAKLQPVPHGTIPAALFFPAGQDAHADWIWQQLYKSSQESGWAFPFSRAARKFFEVEPVFSVPFLIAEECRKAGVRAALVLGAMPGTDLAGHEPDFRYALRHLLSGLSVELGWISYNRVQDPGAARLAFLDMLPDPAVPGAGGGS